MEPREVNTPDCLTDTLSYDTTICAISTAPGTGGIAVARISGPEAFGVVERIWRGKPIGSMPSHTAHLGTIIDPSDQTELDTAVATIFRGPKSYTGQDTVELSVHGSPYIQQRLLQILTENGAVMAQPGQFTRRAFTAGRLDLAQAEAVADIIAASTPAAHRLAASQLRGQFSRRIESLRQQLLDLASLLELELDFTDQDVEFAPRDTLHSLSSEIHTQLTKLADTFRTGDALRRGIPVALAGHTNAGKSTLLNNLLNHPRAIVSPIPGTTRDTIEDTVTLGGTTFRLIDTAGLRDTSDPIEAIGIERTHQAIGESIATVWIVDSTAPETVAATARHILSSLSPHSRLIIALNKSDLPAHPEIRATLEKALSGIADGLPENRMSPITVSISASTGDGIGDLTQALIRGAADANLLNSEATEAVTNVRHYQALRQAAESAAEMIAALNDGIPTEFVAQHLRHTIHHLSLITGAITTPDILTSIFSRFCVGK